MRTEIEGIERALDALLAAMAEVDAKRPAHPATTSSAWAADLRGPIPTRAEMETAQLLREPVFFALRLAVRRLGQHAFAITGTTDGMRDVADRVAGAVPAQEGRRLSMLNSAWDGIGTDADRWWA